MSARRRAALATSLLLTGLAGAPSATAFTGPAPTGTKAGASAPDPQLPPKDVREARAVTPPAATRAARRGAQAGGARVRTDPATGGVSQFVRPEGFLTGPSDADAADVVLRFVAARAAAFGLSAGDVDALALQARSTSPDGVTHLRWVQTADGIPSLDSGLEGHVTADGRLVSVEGGAQPGGLELPSAVPGLAPAAALAQARADAGGSALPPAAGAPRGRTRTTAFATGESATLVAFPEGDGARLAWRVIVRGAGPESYVTTVDAATGAVLARTPITEHATGGDLFLHFPGAPTGGGNATTLPLDAVPAWLNDTAGGTRLAGQYTHTYADVNDNDAVDSGENAESTGGGNWLRPQFKTFPDARPCPAAGCTYQNRSGGTLNDASEAFNRFQATTNLFFHVNRFHDHLRDSVIGFTPASGNFEGADRVLAEANDSAVLAPTSDNRNNANFSTPPNGTPGRMQQYLFTSRDVNSSDDASIIYHEYAHGLTNRLVVDGGGVDALNEQQSRGMGEAWSDFYAFDHLIDQGLQADTATIGDVRVGTYVTGGIGIRPQAMDCEVNLVQRPACNSGGYTYDDIKSGLSIPHGIGVMWVQTLWDIRRAIARSDGDPALSTSERDDVRLLVTGGLRLSPDEPNYVEMRDSILNQAAVMSVSPGGRDHRPLLRSVFGLRGLGTGASSGADTAAAASQDFTFPANTAALEREGTSYSDSYAAGGDSDGVMEPGETVRVTPSVKNLGTAATDAAGVPVATRPGFEVSGGPVSFGSVPTGGAPTSGSSFSLRIPSSHPCGASGRGAAAVQVTSTVGGPTVVLNPAIGPAVTEPADPAAGPSRADALAIPDANDDGTTQTITVPAGTGGPIADLNVRLNITHAFVGDLRAVLTHRDTGTSVILMSRNGDGGDNVTNLVLDDEATDALPTGTTDVNLTGRARSTEPLWAFDGESLDGTWALDLFDLAATDVGTLQSWTLNASGPTPCVVSRPIAQTAAASDLAPSTARLNGTAGTGPGDVGTEYRFVYGTTPSYGAATPTTGAPAGSAPVAADLTGLAPATTYHYRVETLRGGTVAVAGEDATFTTPAPPPAATPTPAPTATPTPSPGIRFTGTPKRITLSSKGTFGLRFGATGGTRGTLSVKATVLGRKSRRTGRRAKSKIVTLVNARAFTADSRGNVVFKKLTASRAGFRKLPKATRSFAAVLQVKVGTRTFTHRFTFQRARRR